MKKTVEFNILKHYLVPQMEIISEKEKASLLKKLGIDESGLPKMLSDDPAVSTLKAEKGDVVKIKREDQTGASYYYRLVV